MSPLSLACSGAKYVGRLGGGITNKHFPNNKREGYSATAGCMAGTFTGTLAYANVSLRLVTALANPLVAATVTAVSAVTTAGAVYLTYEENKKFYNVFFDADKVDQYEGFSENTLKDVYKEARLHTKKINAISH